MAANYDASEVGVEFIRCDDIHIKYPDNNVPPYVTLGLSVAITRKDGTARTVERLPAIEYMMDLKNDGDTPFPLVHPVTGAPLGADTTLNKVFLNILAAVRMIEKARLTD